MLEPSFAHKGSDPVDDCLLDISVAFRMGKPAIVGTHRINYVGSLSSGNRDVGLSALDRLLGIVRMRWPNVEFLASDMLGDTIAKDMGHPSTRSGPRLNSSRLDEASP